MFGGASTTTTTVSGQADPSLADLSLLDDDGLQGFVVRLEVERARSAVVSALVLAEWDARRVWSGDGSRSAAHRLARSTDISLRSARGAMFRARRVGHMPVVVAAVMEGRLSLDHLDLLAQANTPARRARFARDEQFLIDGCVRLDFPDAVRYVRYWELRADGELGGDGSDGDGGGGGDGDGDDGGDGSVPLVVSRLHASRTFDDTVVIDGVLNAVDGAIVERELDRVAELFRVADKRAGVERTGSQRRAAALVEMAARSAVAPVGGRRPLPLFTVLVGERTLEWLCELSNGVVVRPKEILPFLSEALIESVLFDGPSTVISVSSKRTFTGALRRAVQVRDRRCRHPSGCEVPAERCDVDHIRPHVVDGLTSQANGRLECPPHNQIPELHDHGAVPGVEREVTRLDELRCLIRWRCRDDPLTDPHDDGTFDTAA